MSGGSQLWMTLYLYEVTKGKTMTPEDEFWMALICVAGVIFIAWDLRRDRH